MFVFAGIPSIARDVRERRAAARPSCSRRGTVGVGGSPITHLALGDEHEALKQLEAAPEKARNHENEQGYLHIMNFEMNFLADPRIAEPRFAVLSRIRGD